MYHYILLSLRHAIDKYVRRKYATSDIERGWSLDRINLKPESFKFPSRDDLRFYEGDESFDASNPWVQHFFS